MSFIVIVKLQMKIQQDHWYHRVSSGRTQCNLKRFLDYHQAEEEEKRQKKKKKKKKDMDMHAHIYICVKKLETWVR